MKKGVQSFDRYCGCEEMDIVMLISIGLTVFFSSLAAYFDYKTTYIYDWITYPMIIMGIILLPFKSSWYIGLISAAAIFVIFYPLYRYGKIGGGDIKYFMGLCLLIPMSGKFVFILPVFFVAAASAGLFFGFKFFYSFFSKKYYLDVGIPKTILYFFAALLVGLASGFFLTITYRVEISIFAALLLFVCLFVLLFQKYFYLDFSHKVKVDKILEDDVVDMQCLGKSGTKLFDKKLLAKLKESKVAEVIVYRNLPVFGPFLLFGVILSVLVL